MSFFTNIFKKKSSSSIKASGEVLVNNIDSNSFLFYALAGGSKLTPFQTASFYQNSSAVATAIDMIADEIEQIEPYLIDSKGDMTNDSEVIKLIKNPNPLDDRRSFIGKLARDWLLNHNSFVFAVGNTRRLPLELWSIKPQLVNPMESHDLYTKYYTVTEGLGARNYNREEIGKQWRYIGNNLSELYHIMGYSSSRNSIWGDSPLQAAALEVRQQLSGKKHNLALLNNGGRLSLIAIFKDTLDNKQHKDRKAKLNDELGGSANAGKIAIISSEDLELKEVGVNNKDMDYANLDAMAEAAIYKRYKIPLPLVTTEASTYNNVENAKFDLYDRTVLPTFQILMDGLSQLILPRVGINPEDQKLTFNPEQISALKGRMLNELKIRKEINVETPNELRQFLPGRKDIEGGDSVYVPATLVPLGEDMMSEEAAINDRQD
jgi:HK97 family phage portal protein